MGGYVPSAVKSCANFTDPGPLAQEAYSAFQHSPGTLPASQKSNTLLTGMTGMPEHALCWRSWKRKIMLSHPFCTVSGLVLWLLSPDPKLDGWPDLHHQRHGALLKHGRPLGIFSFTIYEFAQIFWWAILKKYSTSNCGGVSNHNKTESGASEGLELVDIG